MTPNKRKPDAAFESQILSLRASLDRLKTASGDDDFVSGVRSFLQALSPFNYGIRKLKDHATFIRRATAPPTDYRTAYVAAMKAISTDDYFGRKTLKRADSPVDMRLAISRLQQTRGSLLSTEDVRSTIDLINRALSQVPFQVVINSTVEVSSEDKLRQIQNKRLTESQAANVAKAARGRLNGRFTPPKRLPLKKLLSRSTVSAIEIWRDRLESLLDEAANLRTEGCLTLYRIHMQRDTQEKIDLKLVRKLIKIDPTVRVDIRDAASRLVEEVRVAAQPDEPSTVDGTSKTKSPGRPRTFTDKELKRMKEMRQQEQDYETIASALGGLPRFTAIIVRNALYSAKKHKPARK